MKFKAFVWLIGLCGALLAGGHALGQVQLAQHNPGVAMQLIPRNGFAVSGVAHGWLRGAMAENAGQFPTEMPTSVRALADLAYSLEPTDEVAVRMAALDERIKGNPAQATQMVRDALSLSRRDLVASLMLIEDLSRSNDEEGMLDQFDIVLRSNRNATQAVLPQLVALLDKESNLAAFERILERQPPWADSFWQQVSLNGSVTRNATRLRLATLEANAGDGNAEVDAGLLRRLVRAGDFALASELAGKIAADSVKDASQSFSGDFDRQPVVAPFDWALVNEGRMGAEIAASSGTMYISAIAGTEGSVAERLFRMPAGKYRLEAELAGATSNGLGLSIRCASGNDTTVTRFSVDERSQTWDFDTGATDCLYYYLSLDVSLPPGGSGLDANLARLSITPL